MKDEGCVDLRDVPKRPAQWVVTDYGLECVDVPSYAIPKSRLWENEATHGWVEHMSEKRWVRLPDFIRGLRAARQRHTPELFKQFQQLCARRMA